MHKVARGALLLAAVMVAGCGSMSYDGTDDQSEFRRAAVSWVGAPLDDMIRAWGEPRERVIEAGPGRDGLVRWRDTVSAGKPGLPAVGHRCIVEARYSEDRTVVRVDTVSHNCDERFAEILDNLTRR